MENIPPVILLVITMSAALGGTLIRKYHSNKYGGTASARYVYNAMTAIVSVITIFIIATLDSGIESAITASPFTILLATAFGMVTALHQITVLKAFEVGPLSYTTVITSLSMLIPALSGAVIWGEHIAIVQYVGIAFMVVCLVLSVNTSKGDADKRRASFKWLMLCAIAFVLQGLIGVMQKWHQKSEFKGELNAFLIIAFAVAFVYSAIMIFFTVKKEKQTEEKPAYPFLKLLPLLIMAVAGLCVALNNVLNLYLSGVIESAIFFPLVNGGNLVLTALSALVLFRERLTARQWIGAASGVISVLLLCNPFG